MVSQNRTKNLIKKRANMINRVVIFLLLSWAMGEPSALAKFGECEIIVPPPTSRDCREHDTCYLPDGHKGHCEQVYHHLGTKCFVCHPVSHNP